MSTLEQAKQLKQNGYKFVPLEPKSKNNFDKDIDTKIYDLSEVKDNGNLGISLHLTS